MNMYMLMVPVVAVVGSLFYTKWARSNALARAAKGEGAQMFHDAYSGSFDTMSADERLVGYWQGLAYVAPSVTAGQIAGKLAKEAALGLIGVSKYTPVIYVGLTTHGRVLIAEEYSEGGKRNNFKVVRSYPAGTQVVVGQQAYPQHQGPAPTNSYSMQAPLELVRFIGPPDMEQYLGWVNGAGALSGAPNFVSIASVLPITPDRAMAYWHAASRPMAA